MDNSEEDWLSTEWEGDEDLIVASRDFEKVAASRNKSGFVEGVEAGKKQGLQEGFSAGFVSGLAVASHWAIFRGRADAIKVYHENKCTSVEPESPEQFQPQLQDTAGFEEQHWRRQKIDEDRKSYLLASNASSKEDISTETEDTVSAEGIAIRPESAKATLSKEGTKEDTEGANDGLRSSSGMTYGELVANMEVPAGMQAFWV